MAKKIRLPEHRNLFVLTANQRRTMTYTIKGYKAIADRDEAATAICEGVNTKEGADAIVRLLVERGYARAVITAVPTESK